MSGVNQPVNPSAPVAPAAPGSGDAAVDAYQRAVQARPTAFAENPIGAMASAMDKLGRAAGSMLHRAPEPGRDGLAPGERRLMKANQAAQAQPNSLAARQEQLVAALSLLKDMQHLKPNDPRRVRVAGFAVRIANQLGPSAIPFGAAGLDVRGLLRLAAQVTSRFGDAAGMQAAFTLEGILRSTLTGSSPEALAARDQLMQRLGIGRAAAAAIANGWAVRLTQPGEIPSLDMSSRTLSLNAQLENPSLAVLARAFWHDHELTNPADKDGFVQAFLKAVNSGGTSVLARRYKEFRRMARSELAQQRTVGAVGVGSEAPLVATAPRRGDQEGAEMFAALSVFSHSDSRDQVPDSLRPPLERFFA